MANTNSPFGFLPVGGADGAAPTFPMAKRYISSANTTTSYRGDPQQWLSTGFIAQGAEATVVSQLAGILWGVTYYSQSQQATTFSKYWPGSDVASGSTIVAHVLPVSTAVPYLFYAQTSNSSTTATQVTFADVGQTIDYAIGTGSTQSGMSGAYLDQNVQGTTATLPFRIIDLWSNYTNGAGPGSAASAYNWVVVQANIYQETGI